MPVHVAGAGLLAVPVAVRLHLVVGAEQADQRALDCRVVEDLPQFGHGFGDCVAGVVVERVELGGDGLVQAVRQFGFDEVIAVDQKAGDIGVVEQEAVTHRGRSPFFAE